MYRKQHTIKRSVSLSGVGLHTGTPSHITFKPAPENHGYVFKRVDLENAPLIKADVDNVVDTSRGTTIAKNGAKVHTVEHTLAALVGLQIDNVLIELDGIEPPAMDGSSIDFLRVLEEAGLEEQTADRDFLEISYDISHQETQQEVSFRVRPAAQFEAQVRIDFNSRVLGEQEARLDRIESFAQDIADSRTFCFLHEVEPLLSAGLIQGGDLDNAVVFVEEQLNDESAERLCKLFKKDSIEVKEGVLNNVGLRHKNEPARHKLLDLVGDLALVGVPIKGRVEALRPGHTGNVALAKKLRAQYYKQKITRRFQTVEKPGIVFDINAIQKILPHRYPFLLVDKIIDFSEKRIVGIKNVTINEPFFSGHFPGNPIMPGVLQIEAMAQVGGILLLNTIENPQSIWVYIVAINNARFKKPVIPGDTLRLELEMQALKKRICKMHGKAFVNGTLVCSADLVASVIPKNQQ